MTEAIESIASSQSNQPPRKSKGFRKFVLFVLVTLLVAWWAYSLSPKVDLEKTDVNQLLAEKLTPTYLNQAIAQNLQTESISQARALLDLAHSLHLPFDPRLEASVAQKETLYETSLRQSKAFFKGAVLGEGYSGAAIAGHVVADFTLVGDVRDLSIEATHYAKNEPVDKLVAGLSIVGIALTAGSVATLGSAAPLKMGASLMKYASKARVISKRFHGALVKEFSKAIRFDPIFKKLNATPFTHYFNAQTRRELKTVVVKNIHFKQLEPLQQNLLGIQKHSGGYANSLKILSYADNMNDLRRLNKFTRTFGKHSATILKVLGKGVLKLTKVSMKAFAKLLLLLLSIAYAVMAFIFSSIAQKYIWRNYSANP